MITYDRASQIEVPENFEPSAGDFMELHHGYLYGKYGWFEMLDAMYRYGFQRGKNYQKKLDSHK